MQINFNLLKSFKFDEIHQANFNNPFANLHAIILRPNYTHNLKQYNKVLLGIAEIVGHLSDEASSR